jgi:hypothetical protein
MRINGAICFSIYLGYHKSMQLYNGPLNSSQDAISQKGRHVAEKIGRWQYRVSKQANYYRGFLYRIIPIIDCRQIY